jgi:hypothetical protein
MGLPDTNGVARRATRTRRSPRRFATGGHFKLY